MILYKLQQDNKNWSRYPGHWFAHAYNVGTIGSMDMARLIEANCSVKRSDVMACAHRAVAAASAAVAAMTTTSCLGMGPI